MKTKLIFDSEKEGDADLLKQCMAASDFHSVLWEMQHNVRRHLVKYADISEEYEKGVSAVFEKFYELMEDYNVNID